MGTQIWNICSSVQLDISWVSVMNEWDTREVEHEKIYSKSISSHVLFLLHRITDYVFDNFLKISQNSPKTVWRPQECFRTISKTFWRLLKKTKDCWRLEEGSKDVLIIHQKLEYSLRVKHNISEIIDIFISEDMETMPCDSWMTFCIKFTSGVFSSTTPVSIQ